MRVVLILFGVLLIASAVSGQSLDALLAQRMLDRVPDIPRTANTFGRGDARPAMALEHVRAINLAENKYSAEWAKYGWLRNDVKYLLAAIAYNESRFSSAFVLSPSGLADHGPMQVRGPSRLAARCGLKTQRDRDTSLTDLRLAYSAGACVLLTHLKSYSHRYASSRWHRLRPGQRPSVDLRYFQENPDAVKFLAIERYNWGDSDLYLHPIASGYARRIHQAFVYFRGDSISAMHTM